jgi:hypothetical protein
MSDYSDKNRKNIKFCLIFKAYEVLNLSLKLTRFLAIGNYFPNSHKAEL